MLSKSYGTRNYSSAGIVNNRVALCDWGGKMFRRFVSITTALLLCSCWPALAQTKKATSETGGDLFNTISHLDTELFDAYNHCDLKKFATMVSPDIEFYHDITGLSVGSQPLIDALKNNICGKVTRVLVPGTLEVYPIANYGAVEMGVHRFHHPGHDDTEGVGEAKFFQLWHKTSSGWKLTRVFSFDHGPAKPAKNEASPPASSVH
jgi:hypothetical protein